MRPARIDTIEVAGAPVGATQLVIPVAPLVVVIVDPKGACSALEREPVIVIAFALISVSRVACVVVITRVEVEHRLPLRPAFGRCCFVSRLSGDVRERL